ncbi:YbjN domain-containing protein [Brevundimonas vitis]|uniref:YbjN domain-containing protein n=1 Tax=Brevundimonas vitisensis TaxID=2800818 RepID=A0ABX7BPV4_9CAUL|nr:YbjN domain-containing protein [Brevundimonas vitisensis]QQQ19617.1 YbjN domain-containing protein [Brevundimonas vitisensis]
MRCSIIAFAGLMLAVIAGPALAQSTGSIPARTGTAPIQRSINVGEVERLLRAQGYAAVDKVSETEFIVLTENELKFSVALTACDVQGQPPGCLGLSILASWSMEPGDRAKLVPVVETINSQYRIAKVMMIDEAVLLERYVITDGGVTLDHIAEELGQFEISAGLLIDAMVKALGL